MFAWTLSMSNAVPRMLPVMYLHTVPCTDCRSLVSQTEPLDFLECACLNGGVYHMSHAYVKAGTATVFYSCLILLGDMPPEIFAILQSCWDHQVALATTLVTWALHLSFGLKITPRGICICRRWRC